MLAFFGPFWQFQPFLQFLKYFSRLPIGRKFWLRSWPQFGQKSKNREILSPFLIIPWCCPYHFFIFLKFFCTHFLFRNHLKEAHFDCIWVLIKKKSPHQWHEWPKMAILKIYQSMPSGNLFQRLPDSMQKESGQSDLQFHRKCQKGCKK